MESSIQYTKELKEKGKYSVKKQDLIKFIGHALTIRQKILSNLYISDDMPEEVWNNQELEKLFKDITKVFDIEQRFRGINMSLSAIHESLGVLVNLLHNAYSNRLEIYIIAIIMMEFVVEVIKTFWK
jgi:uncharacterized Rmd1/YagE family protein